MYSIKITADLQVIVWYEGEKIKVSRLQSIISKDLNTSMAFREIFSYLESQPKVMVTDQEIIEEIIVKLQDPRFDSHNKISFPIEQLSRLYKALTHRRYSSSLLAMTAYCRGYHQLATNKCKVMASSYYHLLII